MTLTVERSRIIDAPLSLVWEIISILDTYHQHTNTLTETTVISGEGQGARRRCVDVSGNSWEENCTIWEPEQRYAIDVDVSTYPTKYRMLFRTFKGTWNVEPAGGQTRVTIRFEAELRRIPGTAMLVDKLAKRSRSDVEAILDSYAQTATARPQ
ncbi:MAG TPA: SRPBCC family protein [Acidimicrobiia bacterium]|nr:SRPBCC family protein [Acidimicrobiia bacterium]